MEYTIYRLQQSSDSALTYKVYLLYFLCATNTQKNILETHISIRSVVLIYSIFPQLTKWSEAGPTMEATNITDVDISSSVPVSSTLHTAQDHAPVPIAAPVQSQAPTPNPAHTPPTPTQGSSSSTVSNALIPTPHDAKINTHTLLSEFNNLKHLLRSSKTQIKKFRSLLKPLTASAKIYLSKQNIPILMLYNKYKVQIDTLIRYIFDSSKPYIPAKLRKIVQKWIKPACK